MTTTRQWTGALTRAQSQGDRAEVTITTPARDLMGDTIDPMQMETETYLRGPAAVNFAHDHATLPVAKTLALAKSPTGIRATFRWRQDPDSQRVKAAFDDGVLGASVEFIPLERPVPNGRGYDFSKTRLTGWGLTGNPANPECVKLFKHLWRRTTAMLYNVDEKTIGAAIDKALGDVVASAVRDCVSREFRKRTGKVEDPPRPGSPRPADGPSLDIAGWPEEIVGQLNREREARDYASRRYCEAWSGPLPRMLDQIRRETAHRYDLGPEIPIPGVAWQLYSSPLRQEKAHEVARALRAEGLL